MSSIFDYFLICVVGLVAGAWLTIGADRLDLPDSSGLTKWFHSTIERGENIEPNEQRLPASKSIDDRIAEPRRSLKDRKIDPGKTLAWLQDGGLFVEDIKYIEEANCSDHAMRQYALFLRGFDTSGFDQKTGRLISGEGKVLTRFQWNFLLKHQLFMLHPLQYMKDDLVPKNFQHVMQAIPRKKDWKTCSFKIPLMATIGSLDF